MSCSRPGCDGIMCDVYVDGIGYVCWECEKEFKEYLSKEGIEPETEGDIKFTLRMFMATYKSEYEHSTKQCDVETFFNQYRRE